MSAKIESVSSVCQLRSGAKSRSLGLSKYQNSFDTQFRNKYVFTQNQANVNMPISYPQVVILSSKGCYRLQIS